MNNYVQARVDYLAKKEAKEIRELEEETEILLSLRFAGQLADLICF